MMHELAAERKDDEYIAYLDKVQKRWAKHWLPAGMRTALSVASGKTA